MGALVTFKLSGRCARRLAAVRVAADLPAAAFRVAVLRLACPGQARPTKTAVRVQATHRPIRPPAAGALRFSSCGARAGLLSESAIRVVKHEPGTQRRAGG